MTAFMRAAALALTLGCTALASQAITLVDTGTPTTGGSSGYPIGDAPGYGTAYGTSFSSAHAVTITDVGAYVDNYTSPYAPDMELVFTLYSAGAPGTSPVLFTDSIPEPNGLGWMDATNLAWVVPAGTYTLEISPHWFLGNLPQFAPNPQPITYFGVNGVWEEQPLSFGVHVYAEPVPEPETCALMLLGLVGIGVAARRRSRR